jgi:hypothetical protein
MGRPCEYTADTADAICARLAQGESLRSVCRDESMPSVQTVFTWMRRFPEFLEQYARAKEESADALTDEILEIADDGRNDWMQRFNADGEAIGWQVNGEHIQRSRVRIDSRKWLASKLKPKKYGDKLAVGGADDLPPVQVQEIAIRSIDATGNRSTKESD